jgi:hypothetical protein
MADRPQDPQAKRPTEKSVFGPLLRVANANFLTHDLKKIVRGRMDRRSPEK